MFLHLSVSHSVHRGAGEYLGRYTPIQVHPPLAGTPHQAGKPPQAGTPPWQVHPPGAVHAGRYGQQADSTHPTGMHSCT